MSTEKRQKRVAGLLFEELSILIAGELEDPRLSLVTVTDVIVSKDLHNVRIYVNHQDDETSKREVLARLNKAIPYLRSRVAERLTLRVVPELAFAYDESPERAARLSQIFQQIASERSEESTVPGGNRVEPS